MDGSAVQELKKLARENQLIEVGGVTYSNSNYREVKPEIIKVDSVGFHTLESLAEFVTKNPQNLNLDGSIMVVGADLTVRLLSAIAVQDGKRTTLAECSHLVQPFTFDKFYVSELFNILLQTRFVYDEQAQGLFSVISKLVVEEGVAISDDGMSSKVTVKRGVSAASNAQVIIPSRVTLKPYRIYPECEQPESQFLIRMSEGDNKSAHVGLWETDGGLWRNKALDIVRDRLKGYGVTLPIYC